MSVLNATKLHLMVKMVNFVRYILSQFKSKTGLPITVLVSYLTLPFKTPLAFLLPEIAIEEAVLVTYNSCIFTNQNGF